MYNGGGELTKRSHVLFPLGSAFPGSVLAISSADPKLETEEHPAWPGCVVEVSRPEILLAFVDEHGVPCANRGADKTAIIHETAGKPHRLAGDYSKDPVRQRARKALLDGFMLGCRVAKAENKVSSGQSYILSTVLRVR